MLELKAVVFGVKMFARANSHLLVQTDNKTIVSDTLRQQIRRHSIPNPLYPITRYIQILPNEQYLAHSGASAREAERHCGQVVRQLN